jgi:cephalosporin hydroxylase
VEQNIKRYETTGKIDIGYLNSLSYTGVLALIDLYKSGADIQGLQELLIQQKADLLYTKNTTWQSYNLTRVKVYEELGKLEF